MLIIRKFQPTEDEYKAITRINNLAWPEYKLTVAEMKNWDKKRGTDYYFQRYVGAKNGEIVCSGVCYQTFEAYHPRKFRFDINVDPVYARQGIGSEFLDFIINSVADKNPIAVGSVTLGDMEAGVSFLKKYGFKVIMRLPRSFLDVDGFSAEKYTGVLERVGESGVRIVSLNELKDIDSDWKRKLYELEWEVAKDVPCTEEPKKRSYEEFEQTDLGSLNFLPDCYFLAIDGNRYVGLTTLWARQAYTDKLDTGLTGVVRSHRRRGIATALKVHAIEAGRKHGIKKIGTDNEEHNPMYDLNMALGFQSAPAILIYEKKLVDERDE